ncbi:F-box protein At1g30200-like [Durio zibethinus]|nr:F-box protein At1g30200-like [Durio zibethinus]
MAPKSATRSYDSSYCQPNGVLKNFKETKSLHLELPSHGDELGSGSGGASFLKWKAEFGSNLKTCIILGATSCQTSNKFSSSSFCLRQKQEECMEETLTDDELKLRVIWTISCLIAASTRHYLFKQILADHPIPKLQRVLISDAKKQGKFYVGKDELGELRNSVNSEQETLESSSMERTPFPELSMKLWYLPMLELPESGYVMRGATLVLIRPVDGIIEQSSSTDIIVGSLDSEGDDGKAFSEAAREMIKVKKSYLMTMSSF